MLSVLTALASAIVMGLVLVLVGRRSGDAALRGIPGWVAFVAGVLSLISVAVPLLTSWFGIGTGNGERAVGWPVGISMTLGLVGVAAGSYAVFHQDRRWQVWVGLVTSGLVGLFWVIFAVGELVYPH